MSIHQTPERDAFTPEAKDPTLYTPKKVTVKSLKQFKNRQQPFAMLTAYDLPCGGYAVYDLSH
jgi:hypothetical protein